MILNQNEYTSIVMVEGAGTIRQGSNFTIGVMAKYADGTPIDLTGKDISVAIMGKGGLIRTIPAVYDAEKDMVRFTVEENIGYGKMELEYTATDPDDPSYRLKFPSNRYRGQLDLVQGADDMDYIGVQVTTVEQLRKVQKAYQDQYVAEIDPKIKTVEEKAAELEQRVETGIGAFTEDTEVVDARDGEVNLGARLNKVAGQLADKTQEIVRTAKRDARTTAITQNIPLVTFIDDDGNPAILTKLLPLAQKYNIPFTICVPSDFAIAASGLSIPQLKELQDNHRFEIASHAKTHTPINNSMSKEQQFIEIYESWKVLRENGFNIETLVYPYGQSTTYAREVASRYYKGAFSTDSYVNKTPINTYAIGRIEFPTVGWTLANYTARVDEAIAEKGWLVIMLHCGAPVHDSSQQAILEQLIQYIQNANVAIVNASDGIDISGNLIDLNQRELYYAKDGKNNIRELMWEPLNPQTGIEKYNFGTLPNQFPNRKVVVTNVYNDNANSPSGGRGVLVTHTQEGTTQEAYQTFRSMDRTFERRSSSATVWGPWRRVFIGIEETISADFGILVAGERKMMTVAVSGLGQGQHVVVTPNKTVLSNIDFQYWNAGGGNLRLTFSNFRGDAQTLGVVEFKLFRTI